MTNTITLSAATLILLALAAYSLYLAPAVTPPEAAAKSHCRQP